MDILAKPEGKLRIGRGLLPLAIILACCAGVAQNAVATASPGLGGAAEGGVVARSARLAFTSGGDVTIARLGDTESTVAQQNMALAQGAQVKTGEHGQVEIEFEDGSVARLTPNSALSIEELRTDSDGLGTMTVLRVSHGLMYFELRAEGVARFRVVAGADSFWPLENTTVRVNLDTPPALVAVLDGRIHLEHEGAGAKESDGPLVPNGYKTEVHTGESIRSDASNATRYFLSEGVATETWDQWNEERDQAAANAIANATSVRQDFAGRQGYGWSDLDANGNWYQADGQAPVWQPGDALAADFDPYGYGSWTYFPGAGYTWASGYGWGWTPYRCGRWHYWDGFGWGWQPDAFCGSSWRFGGGGVNIANAPRGYAVVGVPIRPRPGVHPILSGRHPGERPPVVAWHQDDGVERRVAGVMMRPLGSAGFGATPHGGSALGSTLRRDYPVDGRTHAPLMGTVGQRRDYPNADQPAGVAQSWRTVAPRPDPTLNSPVTRNGWQAGRDGGQRPADSGAVPNAGPSGTLLHRGPEAVQGRSMRATGQADTERSRSPQGPARIERSQPIPGTGMARPEPSQARAASGAQPSPRMEQRVIAPPAPAVHSTPAPSSPALSAPKK